MKAFALIAAVTIAAVVAWREAYLWDFKALRREIQRHENLKITGSWRNDDVFLDDFGFTVRGGSGEFQINLFGESGSSIHTPRDRAEGLLVQRTDRPLEVEVVSFNDPWWKARKLPAVRDLAGFLAHSDEIVGVLAADSHEMKELPGFKILNYRRHIQVTLKKKPGV